MNETKEPIVEHDEEPGLRQALRSILHRVAGRAVCRARLHQQLIHAVSGHDWNGVAVIRAECKVHGISDSWVFPPILPDAEASA